MSVISASMRVPGMRRFASDYSNNNDGNFIARWMAPVPGWIRLVNLLILCGVESPVRVYATGSLQGVH